MPNELPVPNEVLPGYDGRLGVARKVLHNTEDYLLVFCLATLLTLPFAEPFLRSLSNLLNVQWGITFSNVIVQHMTLAVGMIGGAIAARQRRLLSLSSFSSYFKGTLAAAARLYSRSYGAAISAALCVASVLLIKNVTWDEGQVLLPGIPIWTVQAALPIAFGLIALRQVLASGDRWWHILLSAILGPLILMTFYQEWLPYDVLVRAGIILLCLGLLSGAPIFALLGGTACYLFWKEGSPLSTISLKHYSMVANSTLAAVPLFTLAGYFLSEGGASRRLINVFNAMTGHIKGGTAILTVLACTFFTSFTGASGVTILALGGLLMPVLISAKYPERKALGLMTGSGSLGMLFPPCLPLIIYAVIAGTTLSNMGSGAAAETSITIESMFLAGMLPGCLLVGLTMIWGVRYPAATQHAARPPFSLQKLKSACWEAKWELLLPAVALVSLFSGFATPVESAALTAGYALFIEVFVYKDLSIKKDLRRVSVECGLLVGGVLLILGVAMGLTHYLVDAQVPDLAVEWATETFDSPITLLLALNVFLLAVGCLMDIYSAMVVIIPLLIPIGMQFGIHPLHLGIVFLANLELGYLTPPVGMNLFLSSYRFNKPVMEVARSIVPLFVYLLIGVLIITYFPWLSTWLPGLID
jgi:tripartite ATP-independent transporter DctM subunit